MRKVIDSNASRAGAEAPGRPTLEKRKPVRGSLRRHQACPPNSRLTPARRSELRLAEKSQSSPPATTRLVAAALHALSHLNTEPAGHQYPGQRFFSDLSTSPPLTVSNTSLGRHARAPDTRPPQKVSEIVLGIIPTRATAPGCLITGLLTGAYLNQPDAPRRHGRRAPPPFLPPSLTGDHVMGFARSSQRSRSTRAQRTPLRPAR